MTKSKEIKLLTSSISTIDELISLEEKKLNLLKDYKKGLLQLINKKDGKESQE